MKKPLDILVQKMADNGLTGLLVSKVSNICYLTGFNDFDTIERNGFLLVTQDASYIFTHGIFEEAIKKIKGFMYINISREKPFSEAISSIAQKHNLTTLGIESSDLSYSEYLWLKKALSQTTFIESSLLEQMRIQKDASEIQKIKNACALTDKAYEYFKSVISAGKTEIQLAGALDYYCKSVLSVSMSFDTIVAFSKNASQPHHVPDSTILSKNEFVLLDFGLTSENYCSDMTRTVFYGNPTSEQTHIYNSVLSAQEKAISYISACLAKGQKVDGEKADHAARTYLLDQGFGSIPHGLGHGIGIQVHEAPRLTPVSKDMLSEGMVFSIEPGIYIPGTVGVRIEDLFAIENNRLIRLSQSPHKLTLI